MRKTSLLSSLAFFISTSVMAEVCVYEHENYRGGRKCFNEDVRNFGRLGINDSISSLRVHGDVEVILYRDEKFRGRSIVVDHDARWLDDGFNDSVSSMKIVPRRHHSGWGRSSNSGWDRSERHEDRSNRHARGKVCLYSDWQYQGHEQCFERNEADFTRLNFDNKADSIRIDGNLEVTLYEHPDYRGYSRTFSRNIPKFEGHDHDQYSSIRIRHR